MDLPITPKFFKKVEFFQEYRRLEKRNSGRDEWQIEKALLKWAHNGHFHLGSYLDSSKIITVLSEKYNRSVLSRHTGKMMENLVEHGWAVDHKPQSNEIKINRNGMLMAEVLNETDKKYFFYYYKIIIFIVWSLLIMGVFVALIQGILFFKDLVSR